MKLELKHLAAYSKGLQFFVKEVDEIANLVFIDYENNSFLAVSLDDSEYYNSKDYELKPILRNLSDLTKEIEVNDEKFIPKEYFESDDYGFDYFYDNFSVERLFEDGEMWVEEYMLYVMMQKLFEWHFDVFGLIPEGLAIDINTLNK